jgi:TRAP transporter 4TM/12TM fusion protein
LAGDALAPRGPAALGALYCGLIPAIGILWIVGVPQMLGTTWLDGQVLPLCIGLAAAAAFLKSPYGSAAGALEIALGAAAIGCWAWSALNYDAWLISFAERLPSQWIPGAAALLLTLEAMRKICGLSITILVWAFVAYALFGDALGGAAAAAPQTATEVVLYLYADSQGVPGFIVGVVVTLVLAFVVLGKLMEQSGATRFFTDLALRLMAHRRGGAAKVSVVASSAFGMVSGSTVGNVMSTGLVTIPLMKRSGFPAPLAAAIEAVASNGGQLAPPVMGATAFLIAEFLQIDYADVVIVAAVPALLYFVVLFAQIDLIAKRLGLSGTTERTGPSIAALWRGNWPVAIPIAVLLALLFVFELNAARAALTAAGLLLVLAALRDKTVLAPRRLAETLCGSGENLLPILLIAAGAGVVVGVLNSTGLGFQLSLALAALGESLGLLAMLSLTAALSIVLGMGMPTAAVYLVLSVVLAPALVEFGVEPLAAHLFLFYFGVLSMLTPPVAVASFVAAQLAEAGFWKTSFAALKLAAVAYLVPFVWIYNPAVILDGTPAEIATAVTLAGAAAVLLARGLAGFSANRATGATQIAAALGIGLVIAWLG